MKLFLATSSAAFENTNRWFSTRMFSVFCLSDLPHLNRNELLSALFGLGCVTTMPDENLALIVPNDTAATALQKTFEVAGLQR